MPGLALRTSSSFVHRTAFDRASSVHYVYRIVKELGRVVFLLKFYFT